uniref:Teosin n=1 Tax=Sinohyriopsis cumingii TaxID=165450 RepID=A0A7G3FWF2_SINCU|nr:teosin [Sinohyriopsis cumingii]
MATLVLMTVCMLAASQVLSLSGSPVRNVCPLFKCVSIEPPECGKPTYFFVGGHRCRGCDRNICIGSDKTY